ncbi:ATP-binding cassette domain-containing protein [Streptomyces anandii]|uniref:ATP-binding cassette domain-containing protein n=1 Tax=Streptomyces anandii TaxID=285454 RepID=A0ABW6H3K6_9ACTN
MATARCSRTTVLRGPTASLAAVAPTALAGPSGSGKSTRLAVAGALLPPDSGEVLLGGHDIARLSAAEQARLRREAAGDAGPSRDRCRRAGCLTAALTAVLTAAGQRVPSGARPTPVASGQIP